MKSHRPRIQQDVCEGGREGGREWSCLLCHLARPSLNQIVYLSDNELIAPSPSAACTCFSGVAEGGTEDEDEEGEDEEEDEGSGEGNDSSNAASSAAGGNALASRKRNSPIQEGISRPEKRWWRRNSSEACYRRRSCDAERHARGAMLRGARGKRGMQDGSEQSYASSW